MMLLLSLLSLWCSGSGSCNRSCLSIYLSICLSIYLSIYLSTYLSIYLSMYVCMYVFMYVCICLSASLKTKLLWDFLNFWTWQHQKRSNSARLPQFSKLTTSKTRKSAPGPPNSSDEHVSCTALAMQNASLQILFKCPRLPSFLEMPQKNPHVLLTFDKVHNPSRLPCRTTSERPKMIRAPQFVALLTSKCASRHNGVQFFISHLTKCLRIRRFGELTFRPPRAFQSHKPWEKHSELRLFYLFAHLHPLSSDSFSSLIFLFFSSPLWLFPPLLFHLSILSEVWFLNFLQSYRTHFIIEFFKLSLSYHILSFSQLIFWSQDRLATMHRPSSSCWDSGLGSDVADAAAESRWFPFNTLISL